MSTPETRRRRRQGSAAQGNGAGPRDTLTRHRQPHGRDLRAADHRRHGPRDGPAPDQGRRGRIRDDVLRPGVHEHGLVSQRDHLHRRRRGHPAAPRLPDRAAVRALDLPRGRLPADQRRAARRRSSSTGWVDEITIHTFVHENVKDFMQGFRYDANPMGMLVASVGALSTFYPDANKIHDERVRAIQIIRLLAKMPTLAAFAFRHNMGQPYVYPDNDLDYAGNFLGMMYKMTELKYQPDPRLAAGARRAVHPARRPRTERLDERRALGRLDAGRPLLGGRGRRRRAVRPAARRRQRGRRCGCSRGSARVENIPAFLEGVKAGNERLMGFGHRVYKNYDPRARIIRKYLDDVFEVRGKSPLLRRRDRAREARARRRVLHLAQALPERRLLLGPDLRGARPARGDVPGDVRDRPHERLDRAVAGDGRGPRAEDRPPAPDLHRRPRPRLRARSISARREPAVRASRRGGAASRGPRDSRASGAPAAPRSGASGRGSPGGRPRARRRSRAPARARAAAAS